MEKRQNTAFIFEIQYWNQEANHHEKANEVCEKVWNKQRCYNKTLPLKISYPLSAFTNSYTQIICSSPQKHWFHTGSLTCPDDFSFQKNCESILFERAAPAERSKTQSWWNLYSGHKTSYLIQDEPVVLRGGGRVIFSFFLFYLKDRK